MIQGPLDQNQINEFYQQVKDRIEAYRKAISSIGFSPEKQMLPKQLSTPEEVLSALDVIIESSKELNLIFENSPDSIYVADSIGNTLRVNQAFESIAKIPRASVLNRNVEDIEKAGVFKPSVCRLALKEGRSVSVLQRINNGEEIVVTGVPVLDETGALYRVMTNAILLSQVRSLTSYIDRTNLKKDTGNDVREEEDQLILIAESERMQEILKFVNRIMDTDSSILLTGETGVGKGFLAHYIHNHSNRSKHRIMEINCGAIPNNLLESELFGYEGGAFTGADKRGKPGLFEMSQGGTLFLDEISELPLLLQVKLLQFLQSKKITRVGGTREIAIDARIIAGTNKNLEVQVKAGEFRADLFYRLNVIPIEIPPLRKRVKDIRPIAAHFAEKYMRKYNKWLEIQDDFWDSLQTQEWKGNVRELENYMERIVLTTESNCLKPKSVMGAEFTPCGPDTVQKHRPHLNDAVDETERSLILDAYQKYKSSYKVARELGISQATAYRKIMKYTNQD